MTDGVRKAAQRAGDWIARGIKAFGILGSAAILIMMLLTTADVVGRYLFNSPLLWAYEITEYLMVTCVYLALAYTEAQEAHINVTALYSRLSPRAQSIMFIVTRAAILAFCILLIQKTWATAYYSLRVHEVAPTLVATPLGPPKLMVPIGLSLFSVELILRMVSRIRLLWGAAGAGESRQSRTP